MNTMEIDFVITWVNMNESEWQQDFVKYSNKTEKTSKPSIPLIINYRIAIYKKTSILTTRNTK